MKNGLKLLLIISALIVTACTAINSSQIVATQANSRWGIVPFANNTEVPQAGNRATSITAGVLRSRGIRTLPVYPTNKNCSKLIVCPNAITTVEQALKWARRHQIHYVMMGAVNEWDYKVGLDGEPIAGVALQLYHVQSGNMVWSSVGSKIGNSRSGLTVIAQKLITEMLSTLMIG